MSLIDDRSTELRDFLIAPLDDEVLRPDVRLCRSKAQHDHTHLRSVSEFMKNQADCLIRLHKAVGGVWTTVYMLMSIMAVYLILLSVKSFWLTVLAMLLSAIFASSLMGGFQRKVARE
jgi:hypothetical protein